MLNTPQQITGEYAESLRLFVEQLRGSNAGEFARQYRENYVSRMNLRGSDPVAAVLQAFRAFEQHEQIGHQLADSMAAIADWMERAAIDGAADAAGADAAGSGGGGDFT